MNGMAASDKIFALLDLPEPEEKTERLDGREMDISFSSVHFSYEADREILKGVDMEFPAGALPPSQAPRDAARVRRRPCSWDETRDIRKRDCGRKELCRIREDSLMDQITLVSHNSYLFKGTVEENLRMGKPDASEEEMRDA